MSTTTMESHPVALPAFEHLRLCTPERAAAAWNEPELPTDQAESITVASIMSPTAWAALHAGNRLRQEWTNVPAEFVGAYGWMAGQMAARGVGDGVSPPLWAWAQIAHDELVDMCAGVEDDSVFVIASVPASRVLLSSFADWHAVLNRMWCPPPGSAGYPFGDVDAEEEMTPVTVEASWQWCLAAGLCRPDDPVQAALPWLWGHEIVTAVRLQAGAGVTLF